MSPLSDTNKTSDDDASVIQIEGGDAAYVADVVDSAGKKRLCVDANLIGGGTITVSAANIFKNYQGDITTRSEVDLSGTTYTVATAKTFSLSSMYASYDAQATVYVRLKKQTGGAGAFNTVMRITLEVGGQGQGAVPINFLPTINIGSAGDVFKLTVESSLIKGNIFASYAGVEA